MDTDSNDIATSGFGNCLTRDGQGQPSANLPMAGFRHTGAGNGVARSDYAAMGQLEDGLISWTTAGGTADALTATYTPALTALSDGQLCFLRAANANATTTPTFAPNGLTARTITKLGGAALVAGDISGNLAEVILRYNSANTRWELLNPAVPTLPAGSVGSSALAAGAVGTAALAASGVTYAKIQNVAASRLLGNPTGGAAAPSEISLGTGLSFGGSVLNATLAPSLIPNYLSGLTLSTAGGSGTISIAAGVANDSTNVTLMLLASAYTKTTASWVVGSGNGGLDTGAIAANTWYHVYLIERPDTGVVDVLFSLSASAPTMPANYTLKRRIGSIKTDGSSFWTAFTQVGDQFIWAAPVLDVNAAVGTTARVLTTLTVPTGVVVSALFRASILIVAAQMGTQFPALIENDVAVTATGNADLSVQVPSGGGNSSGAFARLTDTSARIGVRSSVNGGQVTVNTYGWIDTRGK